MADPLSFVLGGGGYRAYKYVPWGRVEEVMPYLIRRAQVSRVDLTLAKTLFLLSALWGWGKFFNVFWCSGLELQK